MTLQIAVCDDEPEITQLISRMIRKYQPDCEITEYSSGKELLAAGKYYDLLFLDIQMEDMNGMETAEKIRQRGEETVIIFVTGIKEYVFDAFDVGAFHYLIKPVREEKLKEVLERAAGQIQKRTEGKKRQLFIRKRGRSITISVDDILYLENEMHKIAVHTRQETFTFYGTMSELEQKVGEGFYRCHRGYLVNMAYVAEYDAETICLTNGESVYLAREKYQDFVKQYMRYLRSGGVSHV